MKKLFSGTKITDRASNSGRAVGGGKMARATIIIDREACKGCYLCIHVCTKNAIAVSDKLNEKGYYPAAPDAEKECSGCESCMLVCPEMAVEVYDED